MMMLRIILMVQTEGENMKLRRCVSVIITVVLFMVIQNIYSREEEKIMKRNIPEIYLYNTKQKIGDVIQINARSEKQVMGELYFKNIDDISKVKKYYEDNLKVEGWAIKKEEKILNTSGRRIGDKIIFIRENYEFILNLYPPVNEKWDKVKLQMILNKEAPYYRIYIQKVHSSLNLNFTQDNKIDS